MFSCVDAEILVGQTLGFESVGSIDGLVSRDREE